MTRDLPLLILTSDLVDIIVIISFLILCYILMAAI
jgi:hypothetical protein